MDPFIRLQNVSFSYLDNKNIIKNINLEIKEGEFIALVGPNGCGKSTLVKLFNALFLPENGDVYINGMNTKDSGSLVKIRQLVGLVFQNPEDQIISTIVEEDVAFGPENIGMNPVKIREVVDESLRSVNMFEFRKRAVYQLSGGQKQRLAIASILAMQPRCIILDESTSMLDPKGRYDIMQIIEKLNKKDKITIILITHRMDEIAFADRVIVMNKGEIVRKSSPRDLFSDYAFMRQNNIDISPFLELIHELNRTNNKGFKIPLNKKECIEILKESLNNKVKGC